MFYRYISENFTTYINEGEFEAGNKNFDYANLSDEVAEKARGDLVNEKGFFILPSELFANVQKKASKDADETRSWNKKNSDCMTHAVMLKPASILGLYDLFGNVWEWYWDWYDCYQVGEFINPRGAERSHDNTDRMGRGGAWNSEVSDCSPFFRNCGSPSARYNFIGLRVVRSKK